MYFLIMMINFQIISSHFFPPLTFLSTYSVLLYFFVTCTHYEILYLLRVFHMQKHLKTLFQTVVCIMTMHKNCSSFYLTIVVKLLHKKKLSSFIFHNTHKKKGINCHFQVRERERERRKKSYNLTPDQQPAKTQNATYKKK